MVAVHQHLVHDALRQEQTIAPHKRTLEGIARVRGGEVIHGTAEDVDAALVDGEGRYIPDRRKSYCGR